MPRQEMNHTLTKSYLEMPSKDILETLREITELPCDKGVIKELAGKFNWSYEILEESVTDDVGSKTISMTLGVYFPGAVRIGVAVVKGSTKKDANMDLREIALDKALRHAFGIKDLASIEVPAVNTDNNNKSEPPKKNEPPATKKGGSKFSKEQIDRMMKFKEDYEVTTDEMLVKYLRSWDSSITSKAQLTPDNIDAFLDWMEDEE